MIDQLTISNITLFQGEPRILDLTLAARLGMADPHKIRELISANASELRQHGEVSAHRAETTARGGRPGTAYYLNEPQALLVCMFSRTPKAAIVRKALIEVFMAYRRGEVSLPSTRKPQVGATQEQIAEMRRLWAGGAWPLEHLAHRYNMSVSGVRGHLKDIERYSERPDPADGSAMTVTAVLASLGETLPPDGRLVFLPYQHGGAIITGAYPVLLSA